MRALNEGSTDNEDEAKAYIEKYLDEIMRIDLHGIEIETAEKSFTVTDDGVYGVYDLTVIENICEERKIEVEIIDIEKKIKLIINIIFQCFL